jgi:hypothetical protein
MSQQQQQEAPQPSNVYVTHSPQYDGLSLRASQDFAKGNVVYVEAPIAHIELRDKDKDKHQQDNNSRHSWAIVAQILRQQKTEHVLALGLSEASPLAPSQWEPADTGVLQRLCDVHKVSEGTVRRVMAVVGTNNLVCKTLVIPLLDYHCTLEEVVNGFGLFDKLSRCNHACRPNCQLLSFNGSTIMLRALHPVKQGDDLTISYGRTGSNTKATFGFDCRCLDCKSA